MNIFNILIDKNKSLLSRIESTINPFLNQLSFEAKNIKKTKKAYEAAFEYILNANYGFLIKLQPEYFSNKFYAIINNIIIQYQLEQVPSSADKYQFSLKLNLISLKYDKRIEMIQLNISHEIYKDYSKLQINEFLSDSLIPITYNVIFSEEDKKMDLPEKCFFSLESKCLNEDILNICDFISFMSNDNMEELKFKIFLGTKVDYKNMFETYHLLYDKNINEFLFENIQLNDNDSVISVEE